MPSLEYQEYLFERNTFNTQEMALTVNSVYKGEGRVRIEMQCHLSNIKNISLKEIFLILKRWR